MSLQEPDRATEGERGQYRRVRCRALLRPISWAADGSSSGAPVGSAGPVRGPIIPGPWWSAEPLRQGVVGSRTMRRVVSDSFDRVDPAAAHGGHERLVVLLV